MAIAAWRGTVKRRCRPTSPIAPSRPQAYRQSQVGWMPGLHCWLPVWPVGAAVDDPSGGSGLGAAAHRRPWVFSEGERGRVQLSRALVRRPELLLSDEPAASLDIVSRELLLATLAGFAADPAVRTIVLVTHHVEEISPGFTHVALVADGRICQAGPIEGVLTGAALSSLFGLPVRLSQEAGRWVARGA